MLDLDDLTLLSLDESDSVVTVCILSLAELLSNLKTVECLSVHRDKCVHLVTSVDVKNLTSWTKAVSRVNITTVNLVELISPSLIVVLPIWIEVVDVSTLSVDDLTEETVLGHVESCELEEVIYTVLEHHAVTLSLLCCVYELPALLDRSCSWNLDSNVLAVLHSVNSHRSVHLPVSYDINEVDIVSLAELLPSLSVTVVLVSSWLSALSEKLLHILYSILLDIAKSNDLNTVDVSETVYCSVTSVTKTDEGNSYSVDRISSETDHTYLVCWTCRCVVDSNAILDYVAVLACLSTCCQCCSCSKDKN